MTRKLTAKQRLFVAEYLIDLSATQAAIRAGYSPKQADAIGYGNLRKPDISSAIQKAMDERAKRIGITQDRVLLEYARIAFYDPRKLVDADGKIIPFAGLDEDTARAVVSFDMVSMEKSEGELVKVRLADKLAALNSLARHLGMFNDKMTVEVKGGLAERLARMRAKRNAGHAAIQIPPKGGI